jgi:hypothetical protein
MIKHLLIRQSNDPSALSTTCLAHYFAAELNASPALPGVVAGRIWDDWNFGRGKLQRIWMRTEEEDKGGFAWRLTIT